VEYTWVIDPDASDSLYQVPVIKVENLAYGTYNVTITFAWDGSVHSDVKAVFTK
jgi:hypothetical protein